MNKVKGNMRERKGMGKVKSKVGGGSAASLRGNSHAGQGVGGFGLCG